MGDREAHAALERYASVASHRIVTCLADLESSDRLDQALLAWCRLQGTLVVLQSGQILTCAPSVRSVQNAKSRLKQMGKPVGRVIAALPSVIEQLLSSETEAVLQTESLPSYLQQQRFELLLRELLRLQGTAIHLNIRESETTVSFRCAGVLSWHADWSAALGHDMIHMLFASSDAFDISTVQRTALQISVAETRCLLQTTTMPCWGGVDVIVRVHPLTQQAFSDFDAMGYTPEQQHCFERFLKAPHGLLLVSGPKETGKTTFLNHCLQQMDDSRRMYTLGESIGSPKAMTALTSQSFEMLIASQEGSHADLDADVWGVDGMSAGHAPALFEAASEGCLVLGTLPATSAIGSVSSLLRKGVSPETLTAPEGMFLLGSQRLIPKLCQACAQPITASSPYKAFVSRWRLLQSTWQSVKVRGQDGCSDCQHTGIIGRMAVAEVIEVDAFARQCILKQDWFAWQQALKEAGWLSLQDQAIRLVGMGLCDPMDAETVMGTLGEEAFHLCEARAHG